MKESTYSLIGYPKCSTCRKAQSYLESKGLVLPMRDIKAQPPTMEELTLWIARSGLSVQRWFNTSGMLYREMGLKDKVKTAPKEELMELLASNGMLVKRPILVSEERVLIGFREAEWSTVE